MRSLKIRGWSYQRIARKMGLNPSVVYYHLSYMFFPSDFEGYIYPNIRRSFPPSRGWTIEPQKLTSYGIPDYVVHKWHKRIVIDAKDKGQLTLSDINQLINYRAIYKAQRAIIYIANDTYVPPRVREYAKDWVVKIRRTRWRPH